MRLLISALCATLLSCLIPQHSFAQNEFVNLDFETFIPGAFDPYFGTLPGWGSAGLIGHVGLAPDQVLLRNNPQNPITGVYSYSLISGLETDGGGNPTGGTRGTGISQTGLVPVGSVSLRLHAFSRSQENWSATLGGEELLFTEIAPNEYGANYPANFAGTVRRLSIRTVDDFPFDLDDVYLDFSPPRLGLDNITFSSQPVEFPPLLGDANLDRVVNFADIPAFIAVLSSGDYQREADCDQDEVVDFADIPAFVGILTNQ